ncbi:hypothetical protein G7Y89_g7931 [Cudoniella acicularis]|uniref:DUF1917 domain-containing protein n=1 Tax=Cudoniella acicularis TaxID=354080 RepID=A0A8H4RJ43_9HELO|nr:hypothetical protein G7Y89_g7931 [Cudoniella acicularis]
MQLEEEQSNGEYDRFLRVLGKLLEESAEWKIDAISRFVFVVRLLFELLSSASLELADPLFTRRAKPSFAHNFITLKHHGGDEVVKEELEERANNFNAREWWNNKVPSITELANAEMSNTKKSKTASLYNPYAGVPSARQLKETVNEFLERLPPSTTRLSSTLSWIWIANPYHKASSAKQEESGKGEGPPEAESDWARFVVLGNSFLEELRIVRNDIEKKKVKAAKSTVTKAINKERDAIVEQILDTAVSLHCTSGKWMLFCPPDEVDPVWAVVARATANNELGIAAKVAPDDGNDRHHRLICIYTKDFSDLEDVIRVLKKLKNLGLFDAREKPIYYKCDAYTYLELKSSNEYNIQASLYNSKDLLKPGTLQSKNKNAKVEGFFNNKKKDEGDSKPLEWE